MAALIIGVCLLAILYFVGGRDFYLWASAKQWIETECTIQSASLHSHTSTSEDSGTTEYYRVDTTYWFLDETDVVYGDRYDFSGNASSTDFGPKSRAVRYLKSNPTVPCYYNPRNPEESVINRSFRLYILFMFIPLVLLIMFGLIVINSLKVSSEKS